MINTIVYGVMAGHCEDNAKLHLWLGKGYIREGSQDSPEQDKVPEKTKQGASH